MIGKVQCVVLDCPGVLELARFYQSLLGGAVNQPAFQRVADYRAPRWPDSTYPQQFHLDLDVADLDHAQEQVLGIGATLLRADTRGWRIFADPAGHPFCLLGG